MAAGVQNAIVYISFLPIASLLVILFTGIATLRRRIYSRINVIWMKFWDQASTPRFANPRYRLIFSAIYGNQKLTQLLAGSHILSGAVIEPRALNELLPDWSSRPDHPLTQPATSSSMRFFTSSRSFPIPHPPQMSNKGNYIVSLSRFTAWLGSVAEELGVEVYPGFSGAGLIYGVDGKSIHGVRTNDVGLDRQGRMKDTFEPGMEFRAKVTLLAEGAHGSLSKEIIKKFDLRKAANADPQTYGIGVKEVWRVDSQKGKYRPGEVVHTMGWPLDWKTYGGGWVYHMGDEMVSLGLVIGLDYANPYLSPYQELQVCPVYYFSLT